MKRVHYEVRGPEQQNEGAKFGSLPKAVAFAALLTRSQPDHPMRIVKVTVEDVPLARKRGGA